MKNQSIINKILFSYILVVLVMVLLIGVSLLPAQIEEMDTNLNKNISQTAAMLAADASIQTEVASGTLSDTMLDRLDQIVKDTSDLDYLVLADKNSHRLYHPDHSHFVTPILRRP